VSIFFRFFPIAVLPHRGSFFAMEGDAEAASRWKVQHVFPDLPESVIADALSHTNGDADAAIASLGPPENSHHKGRRGSKAKLWLKHAPKDMWQGLKGRRNSDDGPPRETPEPEQRRALTPGGILQPLDSPGRRLSANRSPRSPRMPDWDPQIALKLRAAEATPYDFFSMNSRLMISTKRRMKEVQQDEGLPEREALLTVGRERLQDRLRCLGLREREVTGDGNCQFRVFSLYLHGTEDQHFAVRTALLKFMATHPEIFEDYFDGEGEFNAYLAGMAAEGEWGDEMTLRACCERHRAVVHLVMSTGTCWYHTIRPEGASDTEDLRSMAMTYLVPVHYNAIVVA
jgi:hypothetical protein